MPDAKIEQFYKQNSDFQEYVDRNAQTYRKTPDAVMELATTRRVYEEMQKGGCNEPHEQPKNL